MSSAANAVRSLIFVAIFKILNVKKIEFKKNFKLFTYYIFRVFSSVIDLSDT